MWTYKSVKEQNNNKKVTVSKKTEETLICCQHMQLSIWRPCHDPNSLSGAPSARIPKIVLNSVSTLIKLTAATQSRQPCVQEHSHSKYLW